MFGFRLRILTVLIVVEMTFMLPGFAKEVSKDDLLMEIDKRLQDKRAKQDAIQAGQERAVLCQSCHGKDGNSAKPDVPNLAGQNVGYLLDQISQFADGRRKDFVMNQLAETFTAKDKMNLAIFYYSMPVKPQQINWHLAYRGEPLYKDMCSSCHGEEGLGHKSLARLAGQQVEYVKNVLTGFRNTANHLSPRSAFQRSSPIMERVAKNLNNKEIEELAAFVAQLGVEDDD